MEGKPPHFLVRGGLIGPEQLERARRVARESGASVLSELVRLEIVGEAELVEFLARSLKLPLIDLAHATPDLAVMRLVPVELARKYCCLPVQRDETAITIATMDPINIRALEAIKFHTGLPVKVAVARASEINAVIAFLAQYDNDYDNLEVMYGPPPAADE
jgi:type IV pilus assembly protein PilB